MGSFFFALLLYVIIIFRENAKRENAVLGSGFDYVNGIVAVSGVGSDFVVRDAAIAQLVPWSVN